jgi:hypothetical protein
VPKQPQSEALIWVDAPETAAVSENAATRRELGRTNLQFRNITRERVASLDGSTRADDKQPSLESDTAAVDEGEGEAPLTPSEAEADHASSTPRLTLNQLGIGDENPFVTRRPAPRETARQRGISRFKRSLDHATMISEQARGLGPEGPVLKEIENAVYASSLPLETTAVWIVVTDKAGNVTHVEVSEATTDKRLWDELARNALAKLQKQKLRVTKNQYGVRLQIQVASKNLLPSGRDPGITTTLFGIPISKGEGKRSTRLEILNPIPKLKQAEQGPDETKIPGVELHIALLAIDGDPADIGARPRRMVHARLKQLSLETQAAAETR